MVNIPEFTSRLKKVIDFHQLTASMFADKIGVQRSSISHILSGRNKPSLDFILKVIAEFNEVDMYWLLNGKGTFPKKQLHLLHLYLIQILKPFKKTSNELSFFMMTVLFRSLKNNQLLILLMTTIKKSRIKTSKTTLNLFLQ